MRRQMSEARAELGIFGAAPRLQAGIFEDIKKRFDAYQLFRRLFSKALVKKEIEVRRATPRHMTAFSHT